MGSRQDIIEFFTELELDARRAAAQREAAAKWDYEHGADFGPSFHFIIGVYSVDDRFWEGLDAAE